MFDRNVHIILVEVYAAGADLKIKIPPETSAKLLFASVAAVCNRRIARMFVRNGGHRPPLQLFGRGLLPVSAAFPKTFPKIRRGWAG
jgi:hypothetical protein